MSILVSRASAATVTLSSPQEIVINKDDDTITVYQPTHDNLNANANIQVNNTDVGPSNPVPVYQGGFNAPLATDAVVATYPDAVTEVYDFKSGGTGGTTLMTVTIVYTTAAKTLIDNVVRT